MISGTAGPSAPASRVRRGAIICKAHDLARVGSISEHDMAIAVGTDRKGLWRILKAVLDVSYKEFKRMSQNEVLAAALEEMGFGEARIDHISESTEKRRDANVQPRQVSDKERD